jgi:hypothetical protein
MLYYQKDLSHNTHTLTLNLRLANLILLQFELKEELKFV